MPPVLVPTPSVARSLKIVASGSSASAQARIRAGGHPFTATIRDKFRDGEDPLLWSRVLPTGLEAELERWASLHTESWEDVRVLPDVDLCAATQGILEPWRTWLARDMQELLVQFGQLADARRLRLRFGPIRTDKCRRFHVDYVRYRLITTYAGPGTEWVPDHCVNWNALGCRTDSLGAANTRIVARAESVCHAVAGDVLVMKGALHPFSRGVVHRSPPIEGIRKVRVVLVASSVEDDE